jgi:hypothetical protein
MSGGWTSGVAGRREWLKGLARVPIRFQHDLAFGISHPSPGFSRISGVHDMASSLPPGLSLNETQITPGSLEGLPLSQLDQRPSRASAKRGNLSQSGKVIVTCGVRNTNSLLSFLSAP